MRPRPSRMTTMKRTSPTPPVGAYPHFRLCCHRGNAPKSAKTKITISTVPSMFCSLIFKLNIFPKAATSDHDNDDANAGMEWVIQKVPSVDVVNINVVGVKPAHWPRLTESEPVASVLEARLPLDNDRAVDHEHVLAAEICPKTVVRNAAVVAIGALCLLFVLHRRLLLLWFFLFLLSLFLFLLGRLFLLRLLLLLLRLLLSLGRLFLLRLLLLLLRLLLSLGRLLRLRLFLYLLAVFLLLRVFFLRVNGSCGSQGQRQYCGADNSCQFHRCCLHLQLIDFSVRAGPITYRAGAVLGDFLVRFA